MEKGHVVEEEKTNVFSSNPGSDRARDFLSKSLNH